MLNNIKGDKRIPNAINTHEISKTPIDPKLCDYKGCVYLHHGSDSYHSWYKSDISLKVSSKTKADSVYAIFINTEQADQIIAVWEKTGALGSIVDIIKAVKNV